MNNYVPCLGCPSIAPSPSHHLLPVPLKAIMRVLSFYFFYVYEVHQLYCFIFISISSFPQVPLHTHTCCTCFTVLAFIISSKVNVQRSFSTYPSTKYALLWSVQPPSLLLSLICSFPLYITWKLSVHMPSTCTGVKYLCVLFEFFSCQTQEARYFQCYFFSKILADFSHSFMVPSPNCLRSS
jgi:hypothetical protein